MDQKNIGQVSGVNDRERQDFSGLNSLGVEQVPEEVGQMPSGGFGAERVPTGMTQDEAVARLNRTVLTEDRWRWARWRCKRR